MSYCSAQEALHFKCN